MHNIDCLVIVDAVLLKKKTNEIGKDAGRVVTNKWKCM